MKVVECTGITKTYGRTQALTNVSFAIEEQKMTGLIGRNGAGKTTLLRMMAGFLRPTSGQIKVFGENPFNNLKVASSLIFIDDRMVFLPALSLADILDSAGSFYPKWNGELARRLLDYFSLHPKQTHGGLSKGMRSTFNMIIGLAARSELTLMDEPTSGMDSAVRRDFYRALLKDYMEHPRTIILSSHLLNELEDILEDIVLIHNREVRLHSSLAELKEMAVAFSGNPELVAELTQNKEVFHSKVIGSQRTYAVVKNDFSEEMLVKAKRLGVDIAPVSADDLCVYLTGRSKGGIDDVFESKSLH